MAPPRIRKTFSRFAPDLQIDLKETVHSTASTGPSSPIVTTSPRTEKKKRRKHKSVKRTVTSEMVSPPEKKKKVISESPDFQAEGPFYDTDTVSAPEDSPHVT